MNDRLPCCRCPEAATFAVAVAAGCRRLWDDDVSWDDHLPWGCPVAEVVADWAMAVAVVRAGRSRR